MPQDDDLSPEELKALTDKVKDALEKAWDEKDSKGGKGK